MHLALVTEGRTTTHEEGEECEVQTGLLSCGELFALERWGRRQGSKDREQGRGHVFAEAEGSEMSTPWGQLKDVVKQMEGQSQGKQMQGQGLDSNQYNKLPTIVKKLLGKKLMFKR